MKRQFRTWAAVTGAATVATAGLLIPTAAGAATVHTTPLRTMAASTKVRGPQADKSTQVHMNITNSTGQRLNLTSATDSGKDTTWQDRPAQTLEHAPPPRSTQPATPRSTSPTPARPTAPRSSWRASPRSTR
jgi:hypothetical protein